MLETIVTAASTQNFRDTRRKDLFDQQLNQKRLVKLKTCADVYEYWRAYKRLYKKAPKDGVEFQLEYIDTGLALDEDVRATAPIALALHGAPGSYQDFTLLIRHLSLQNVRVIAPNFPEYTATVRTKVLFRHSADEKAAYLRDFLKAINVTKIDLLVSHSSAIFPTLLIVLNANNEAIARKRKLEKQQQQQQNDNGVKIKESDQLVSSLKDISLVDQTVTHDKPRDDQLDRNVAQADNCTPIETLNGTKLEEETVDCSADRTGARGEQELSDEEDSEDEFEDAKCDVDNNNNSCNKTDKSLINSQQEKADPARRQRRTTSAKLGRKRRSKQDVIVKFDQPIEIKAVALLNPAGHRLPKSMKPAWFKCGAVQLYQHKVGRSLVRKLGPAFLSVIGSPVRIDNMDNVMLSATVMRNSRCHRVVRQLEQLSELKVPTLLVFSENDRLIEKEIFYEMTQFMKLDPKNFDVFNNEGDIELSQSRLKDWIRVMVFKAGGHYAYSNYSKTVNKAVSELLQKVTRQDETKPIASA